MTRPTLTDPPASPNSTVRSFVSLAVLIHLCVVFVALSYNLAPSQLQVRLLQAFSPYAQPLNLKLSDLFSHKLYHYTHGVPTYDNHFLELEFKGGERHGEIVRLPNAQWPGSPNRNRYQALTHMLGLYAEQENDDIISRLLTGIAAHYLQEHPDSSLTIRVRRHAPVPLPNPESPPPQLDPNAPQYFETLYVANAGIDSSGRTFLTKLDAAGQVAPLRNSETENE